MNTYTIELRKVTTVEFEIQAETYDDAVKVLNERLNNHDESEYHELVAEFVKKDIEDEYYYIPALAYVSQT